MLSDYSWRSLFMGVMNSQHLTLEELQAVLPRLKAKPQEAQQYLEPLNRALERFEINTSRRQAAFLAQIGHESGDLRYWQELWGPTAQQKRYEPPGTLATRLGNTERGDGKRFRGRGPIQLTGRANYRSFGELLGANFEASPDLVATPEWGFLVAGQFWHEMGGNGLADETEGNGIEVFAQITRRINGGLTGLDDRMRRWQLAKRVLQVDDKLEETWILEK